MEKMGANVVAYDLSDKHKWDIVPYSKYDYKKIIESRKKHIIKLNNNSLFTIGGHVPLPREITLVISLISLERLISLRR